MKYVAVFIGGALGGLTRYLMNDWLYGTALTFHRTLLMNMFGAFVLGWLVARVADKKHPLYLGVTVGFLGAFTTFSAFSNEVLEMLQADMHQAAFVYSITMLLVGLISASLGMWIGRGKR